MRLLPLGWVSLAVALPLLGCPGDDAGSDPTSGATGPVTGTTDAATNDGPDPTAGMDETSDVGPGGQCLHQCSEDADCMIDGADVGQHCEGGRCTAPADACVDDAQCVAALSGWGVGLPCTMGGLECEADMLRCIDVGGEGHCVNGPNEFFMCATAMLDEIMVTDIDGNEVIVCGRADARCGADGACFFACTSDDDCDDESAPVCGVVTGRCGCGEDAHCATLGNPAVSVCNDGVCGCANNLNCTGGGRGDVCNDGVCGCTGDAACSGFDNQYDGGTISCVAP